MQKKITLTLLPSEAADENVIKNYIAASAAVPRNAVTGFIPIKRSVDARGRQPMVQLTVNASINEPFHQRPVKLITFRDVSRAKHSVMIAGAGPAGLFAALRLIEAGIKPVIIERGKDVRARRRDLAAMNKDGIVNPESNYCFGEGGAGTYSDGKLYTRSTKRGDVNRVLNLLVQFGAEETILFESHPHIGTNKLPQIITAMRTRILESGGEFHFEKRLTAVLTRDDHVHGVELAGGGQMAVEALVLATGHSARDIFIMLDSQNLTIEFKPFAIGVRVEHPQTLIDSIQYHALNRGPFLPPASYSLVQQVDQKGVFSFCMCPGGIIAPAATSPGEIVVNGWSPSRRNNPYANSGIVVGVEEKDVQAFRKYGPLAGMYFQQMVEQQSFKAGGGNLVAPAQRLVDFCRNKLSADLPGCSYLPGIRSASLKEALPPFILNSLQQGFMEFGKKMKGYLTNEAVVVATESRTSSPLRIPRDKTGLHHPQLKNLYPCGEGAGYAGGIVSAAMDGEKIADHLSRVFS